MRLFVYGTLKQGGHNSFLLEDASFLGKALLPNHIMYSLGGFPGVVSGNGTVKGELYEVDDFKRLDRLEGYDPNSHTGMYLRSREVCVMDDQRNVPIQTHVYIWNRGTAHLKQVEDGEW